MLQKPSEQLMRERGAVLEKEGAEVNLPALNIDLKFDRRISSRYIQNMIKHCTMRFPMSIDILEVHKCKNSLHAHFIVKSIHFFFR